MQAKLVKNNLESIEISSSEWYSLNQFLYEIKQIDSPCVSVYYPYGKGTETISLLQETKRKESFEKIESEIEKYYINRNGNKYHKLSEFYNWYTNEKKLDLNTKLNQEFPSNQSIENLINSIDL